MIPLTLKNTISIFTIFIRLTQQISGEVLVLLDVVTPVSKDGEVFQTNQQFPLAGGGGLANVPEQYPFLPSAGWTDASSGMLFNQSAYQNGCGYENIGKEDQYPFLQFAAVGKYGGCVPLTNQLMQTVPYLRVEVPNCRSRSNVVGLDQPTKQSVQTRL
jgi:hypothetical protein